MANEGFPRRRSQSVSTKLYVGNLPETCRRADLLSEFDKYGKVVECDIVNNYAFVHFEKIADAKDAAAAMDGKPFQGAVIKCELSHSKVRQKPGMGGKNECYRCGSSGHWSRDCPKAPPGRRLKGQNESSSSQSYPPPPYPYRDAYRDPYDYYRDRYPPPDRYRLYADPYDRRALPPPPRDSYYRERERDPYARPPPDYYSRSRTPPRDPYYDYYARRSIKNYPPPLAPNAGRSSPGRQRAAPY